MQRQPRDEISIYSPYPLWLFELLFSLELGLFFAYSASGIPTRCARKGIWTVEISRVIGNPRNLRAFENLQERGYEFWATEAKPEKHFLNLSFPTNGLVNDPTMVCLPITLPFPHSLLSLHVTLLFGALHPIVQLKPFLIPIIIDLWNEC